MKVACLVLLCLVGVLSLPIVVKADGLWTPYPWTPYWSKYVVRNVTDTGTFTVYQGCVLVCDHENTYTDSNRFILGNGIPKRVFFTIGIIEGLLSIPENPAPTFVVYQMEELPNNADIVSVCRLFGSRPMHSGPTLQNSYDASFDLDGNGIINMRDVATAIGNFRTLAQY